MHAYCRIFSSLCLSIEADKCITSVLSKIRKHCDVLLAAIFESILSASSMKKSSPLRSHISERSRAPQSSISWHISSSPYAKSFNNCAMHMHVSCWRWLSCLEALKRYAMMPERAMHARWVVLRSRSECTLSTKNSLTRPTPIDLQIISTP